MTTRALPDRTKADRIRAAVSMADKVRIREAVDQDLPDILSVTEAAFGQDEEAKLVKALLRDPSAQPSLSLVALKDARPVGHILFTTARLTSTAKPAAIVILAPLSVVPDMQRQGIGGQLVEAGLRRLSESGVDLVFVLGHPAYYPRHGFTPAGRLGFETPYPIPEKNADAWMVKALSPDMIGVVQGKVRCADAMSDPVYWHE